MEIFLKQAI